MVTAHFHLPPAHTQAEAGSERLQRRLLSREAYSEMGDRIAPAAAIGDLVFREHAAQELLVPPLDDLAHAGNPRQIDADPPDVPGKWLRQRPIASRIRPANSAAICSI